MKLFACIVATAILITLCATTLHSQTTANLKGYKFQNEFRQPVFLPLIPGRPGCIVIWDSQSLQCKEALLKFRPHAQRLSQKNYWFVAIDINSSSNSVAWLKKARMPMNPITQTCTNPSLIRNSVRQQLPLILIVDQRAEILAQISIQSTSQLQRLNELLENFF
jgi:hypothetical protein